MNGNYKNSVLLETIERINCISQERPIILHTNAGVVAKQIGFRGTNKKHLLHVITETLQRKCRAKSIFIPTFDYEYCSSRLYDPSECKTQLGGLSKFCAEKYVKNRTYVPVFNHVDLKKNHPPSNSLYSLNKAFGINSFYDWFTNQDGFIFFWGCDMTNSNTYIHHIETLAQVSYRYVKHFNGVVLVNNSKLHTCLEFNVRPVELEINYLDQGRSDLSNADILISDEKLQLEGYSAQLFLENITPSIEKDQFHFLTDETRINVANYYSNPNSLRKFSEEVNSILIISDSTLDFVTRGWRSAKYSFKAEYASSLYLKLDDLCTKKDLEYSVMIIMPSQDSYLIGPLELTPNSPEIIFQRAKSQIEELVSQLKKFKKANPGIKLIYISPLNNMTAYQLADSQCEALALIEVFVKLERIALTQCDDAGVAYENIARNNYGGEQINFSWLNYLRYRFPYEIKSIDAIRSLLINILNKKFIESQEIKAISVDLDNTLWLGIAGDDEVQISNDYPAGASILLQKVLKQMRDRGVFLTITSKNDLETVERIFTTCKNKMLLTLDDFTCIEANWGSKSSSLVKQAKNLNIDVDSFLHIDDSDLELNEIMARLPAVEVLKFCPENIDKIINHLLEHPRLSKVNITNSDKIRASQKPIFGSRSKSIEPDTLTKKSYLKQLQIKVSIIEGEDQSFDSKRVAQLLAKTNQFNASQKKYDYFNNSPKSDIFSLNYSDKNSLEECCSVMCVSHNSNKKRLEVCSFVLSCRFFSRGLEYYFLEKVWNHYDAKELLIKFRKTTKNKPFQIFIQDIALKEESQHLEFDSHMKFVHIPIDLDKLHRHSANFKKHYMYYQL